MTVEQTNPSGPEDDRRALTTASGWLALVVDLERKRDVFGACIENPLQDADYNFLLGQLSVAHEQLRNHVFDDAMRNTHIE